MASSLRMKNLDPRRRQKIGPHRPFNVRDVPRTRWSAGKKFGGVFRKLGEYGGRKRIGVHLEEIPPGRWNSTFHWHTHEEEHFFILEGQALMRIGRRKTKVRAGDYVVFPPNGRQAHAMVNTGRKPLRFIVIGTRESGDVCVYPDSGKVAIGPLRKVGRFRSADYWDGEI